MAGDQRFHAYVALWARNNPGVPPGSGRELRINWECPRFLLEFLESCAPWQLD
jgi:hypothetical protein